MPASEDEYDAVATIIDPLTKRVQWILVKESELTVEKFTKAFISGYIRNWELPLSIVSDWDTRFTFEFLWTLCSQPDI
jgi:hypothetical protein